MDRVAKVLSKQKGKVVSVDDVWNFMCRKGFVINNVMSTGLLWRQNGTNNFIFIEHTDDTDGVFVMNIKEVTPIYEPNN